MGVSRSTIAPRAHTACGRGRVCVWQTTLHVRKRQVKEIVQTFHAFGDQCALNHLILMITSVGTKLDEELRVGSYPMAGKTARPDSRHRADGRVHLLAAALTFFGHLNLPPSLIHVEGLFHRNNACPIPRPPSPGPSSLK